jgi:hypothetical protein
MAVATAGAPARRERAGDAAHERVQRTPIQLDERPDPLAPTRGIALAVVLGLSAWALAIAAFLVL